MSSGVEQDEANLEWPCLVPIVPRTKYKATIIAVHGFNGHYLKTWSNDNIDPPFFWLKDGLEKDMQDCRVFSYGYDIQRAAFGNTRQLNDSTSGTSEGFAFKDLAADLHARVQNLLENENILPLVPIIFIAHSLGGTIVKQVLLQSARSERSLVYNGTIAIIFLGTPHKGSGTSWESAVAKTMSHAKDKDSRKSKPENWSGKWSESLSQMQSANHQFVELASRRDLAIGSFYESRLTAIGRSEKKMIVNKHEATLSMSNEIVGPLTADHASMARFVLRDDDGYVRVLDFLRSVIHNLPKPVAPGLSLPHPPSTGTPESKDPKRIDVKVSVRRFMEDGPNDPWECAVSDLLAESPKSLLGGTQDSDSRSLVWVHCPLNNTSWVNRCLEKVMHDCHNNSPLLITEQEHWLSHERKRKDIPHSRYFEPSFCLDSSGVSGGKNVQFIIYLPYLHWDSVKCFKRRTNYFEKTKDGNKAEIPKDLFREQESIYQIIRDDHTTASLHPRRSLDQFFYSTLSETSFRDEDQVLSKYSPKGSPGGKKNDYGGSTVALVHRYLEPRKEKEAIMGEKYIDDKADIHQAIIDGANKNVDAGEPWFGIVALIVEKAVNTMLGEKSESSLDVLDVFRSAIGQVTEKQTEYFRQFQKMNFNRNNSSEHQTETKRKEVNLVLEISDSIDELNIIYRLFQTQRDALMAAKDGLLREEKNHQDHDGGRYISLSEIFDAIITDNIEDYMKQVERMIGDAERTKNSLKDLLDLQQKEETLREAQYSNEQAREARKQADAIEKQSRILFLFTIVTIIFAPLSFFTSYFGMNVREFTGDEKNTNQKGVWMVMGPISAAIIFGLALGAHIDYVKTKENQENRNAKGKGKSESGSRQKYSEGDVEKG